VKDRRRPTQIDLELIREVSHRQLSKEAHIALHLKQHDGAGEETQKNVDLKRDLIKEKGGWGGGGGGGGALGSV